MLRFSGFQTVCAVLVVLASCRQPLSDADRQHLRAISDHRLEVDSSFRHDPNSPFNSDPMAHFTGIKWFPPDLRFSFSSKLHRYARVETVTVFGTKGEARKEMRYGYFALPFEGTEHRLNVYKSMAEESREYGIPESHLSVWFTDETTGKETYNVGRYVDVEDESPDPDHEYRIDFNNAYNPYCAYSDRYSCAIPGKEDHLAFSVRAGELKYH